MNAGKRFENDIKNSIPNGILLYRLPDAAQSFGHNDNLRFSLKSPFDFLMWDSNSRSLYALEMKSVQDKSISFERTSEDRAVIHLHQIEGLKKWDEFAGTICGFIIEFREIETTIFLTISEFCKLADAISKKSFRIEDLQNNGITYYIIPQKKKITHYSYDIDHFIQETKCLSDMRRKL